MKAMILAAGLGTRLRPLTEKTPKALLSIGEGTLLSFAIRKLKIHGFDDLIINVHHFSDQVIDYLQENNNFNCQISISDESEKLLDTGGAIKKASWFFSDGKPFLVWNADIVCGIDLNRFYNFHIESGNMVSLAVRRRESSRYLLFDENMRLTEWMNVSKGIRKLIRITEKPPQPFAFSGIHIINPKFFSLLGEPDVFSIVDAYLEIGKNFPIGGYVDESPFFADAGKPESLSEAGRIASLIKV
jgi:mannose-1-phosphate guanylyltransferase